MHDHIDCGGHGGSCESCQEINLDHDEDAALAAEGAQYYRLAKFEEAEASLQKALRKDPENVNAIAGSLVANASGAVKVKITVLITPEEVDQAVKKTMDWRPPGQ